MLGGEDKVAAIVDKHRAELQDKRTLKLNDHPALTGDAEYFVLLGAAKSGTSVDGAKFVSGEEKLRTLDAALQHLKPSLDFPDDTPTKILRRGVLSCSQATHNCNFVFILPDDVRSID